jgi:hypothetical protein
MQAITALLVFLATESVENSSENIPQSDKSTPVTKNTVISQTSKALRWLHHLGFSSLAAARAFKLCESFVRRMDPSLGFDLGDLASSKDFPSQGGDVDMFGAGDLESEGVLDGLAMVDDG